MEKKATLKLLEWYDAHRRILPWREDPTPYHVWVSEIMLQQTRVEVGIGYYERFIAELPDVKALAQVSEERLMKLWQGLGYYSRARNLHRAAQMIVDCGSFPETREELLKLPGVGAYTAGAILSIAFQKPFIAPDGNAYRVAARLTADDGVLEERATQKRLEEVLQGALSTERPGAFNQALMDLGSGVCLAHGRPRCDACPLSDDCQAFALGNAEELPRRRAKAERKVEHKNVYILRRHGKVLLVKRPKNGLLAGLWGLPLEEREAEEGTGTPPSGSALAEGISLGRHRHVFSHVTWQMDGYLYDDDGGGYGEGDGMPSFASECVKEASEGYVWADPRDLETVYSVPAAFWPFLTRAQASESTQKG
ncbi:MAG: A/G-specific adenine glycosylase [Peptoniphilaceae bacterium]|nr:A/G-specific adenine glycosylase [Peptoniphilaceae bacterium]